LVNQDSRDDEANLLLHEIEEREEEKKKQQSLKLLKVLMMHSQKGSNFSSILVRFFSKSIAPASTSLAHMIHPKSQREVTADMAITCFQLYYLSHKNY
jgi:hypothetical protein